MKKIVIFMICAFALCQLSLAQQSEKLKRVKDSLFIFDEGKRYIVNRNIITVKPKSENIIEKNLEVARTNKLGYIDIIVPQNADIEDYVNTLKKTGTFDVVEYNNIGEYCFTPNDNYINNQWFLNNINAFSAWDISMGRSNIIVGILDAGTDWQHPDIGVGSDGYKNINEQKGWNFATNNNNVITNNNHGTMVAGIVAAKTNNSTGISGIAGGNKSPGIKMIPICVGISAPDGSILDDAIIYAVDNGARVIQLSLSVAQTSAIDASIDYAKQHNVVIICASGNNYRSTVSYPASHRDVIAVGATDQNNIRADFSNYGYAIDVVAPGVNIFSTTLNNTYVGGNGTSFAAPIVSGIAALMLSVNPNLTQKQVRDIIESTAQKVRTDIYGYSSNSSHPNGSWNNQVGYGLVDAYEAVNGAIDACTFPAMEIAGPNPLSGSGRYKVSNLPAGATVTWEVDPKITKHSIVSDPTLRAIGTSLQKLEDIILKTTYSDCSEAWVKATIKYYGCTTSLHRNIRLGSLPDAAHISTVLYYSSIRSDNNITRPMCGVFTDQITYNGAAVVLNGQNSYGLTEAHWKIRRPSEVIHAIVANPNFNASNPIQKLQISPSVPFRSFAYIDVRLANDCGWSDYVPICYRKIKCAGSIRVSYSPNPTTDELTVTFEELPTMSSDDDLSTNALSSTQNLSGQPATTSNKTESYSVKLLDASGAVLRQAQFNHSNGSGKPQPVKFNVVSLRRGTYFLHVEGGGELIREQIMVN